MLVKPLIVFNGQAEDAILFYQQVFNGEIENLLRFGAAPDGSTFANLGDKDKRRLLNARLDFGNNQFNVSDCFSNEKLNIGDNIALDVVFFDENSINTVFQALSIDGKILMSLTKVFFLLLMGRLLINLVSGGI